MMIEVSKPPSWRAYRVDRWLHVRFLSQEKATGAMSRNLCISGPLPSDRCRR
jgi:hypothetical protein